MEQQATKGITLLQEKQKLFDRYEAVTDGLLGTSDIDSIEKYITERDGLANKIDEIDCALREELSAWGETGAAVLAGRAEADALPPPLRPLLALCLTILETVRRIRLKNAEAVSRYSQLRDDSVKKLKNSTNVPKISRYLSNLSGEPNKNNFGSV